LSPVPRRSVFVPNLRFSCWCGCELSIQRVGEAQLPSW
jgi:hypothetical protein